jgi:hypothetical protein
MCPSLDFLRNMPKWVSRKDGGPSRHPNAPGDPPGKAAFAKQPVGHTFAIIRKGVIIK